MINSKLFKSLRKVLADESGATLVEYGVALIVAVVVGGTALSSLAAESSDAINTTSPIMPNAEDVLEWRSE